MTVQIAVEAAAESWGGPGMKRKSMAAVLTATLVVALLALLLALPAVAAAARPPVVTQSFDLVIYSSSMGGLGALREFTELRGRKGYGLANTTILVLTAGHGLEAQPANGLCVEDLYEASTYASGPYKVFRDGLLKTYSTQGITALNSQGRLVYESETAAQDLWGYVNKGSDFAESGRTGVTCWGYKSIVSADPANQRLVIETQDHGTQTITGKIWIDASPTLDVARAFGVDYNIAKDGTPYNDVKGNKPPRPTSANNYVTAPQLLTALPTYRWASGTAPSIADFDASLYDSASYDEAMMGLAIGTSAAQGFEGSWSNTVASLPYGKHELNEAWTDYANADAAFDWALNPAQRPQILRDVQNWAINGLRYLQESYYPDLELTNVWSWPYFRGEVIADGLVKFTKDMVGVKSAVSEPGAFGYYQTYDRHSYGGVENSNTVSYVWVPWKAMMPKGFTWLLCPEGACSDYRAYDSAFRMEHVRMNYGGTAGITASLALLKKVSPQALKYSDIQPALTLLGYKF
jgi:hypothetical protein